ncbi:PrgI family protein [Ruthenibacterium lactatiformans]|uniref:PrgI family protein n=1 Tax=Ruthenibacterium lactatiformans TaxID=1550024 RepID=A0A0D8IW77_9FIRM|nr:hypothetical protein TQ39_15155 [Ruthenibacterium lactatiformans]
MQNKISKEIRTYREELVLGLSLRQLICSGVAVGAAVGSYFALRGALGQETVSWVCIACAAPVAAAGFFTYDGMTFEQFLCAWWETVFLRAGPRVWKSENQYEQKMTTRKEKKGGWRAALFHFRKHRKEEIKGLEIE